MLKWLKRIFKIIIYGHGEGWWTKTRTVPWMEPEVKDIAIQKKRISK